MGTSSSNNKRYYLKKNEIENICRNNPLFNSSKKYKNSNVNITINHFKKLTNGLISNSILKRIMLICETKHGKFNTENLKYFYALLFTNNPEAKLNFLLDLLFLKKNILIHETYVINVNKYFKNCKTLINLFLKEEFNSKQKIERDYINKQIKTNYITIINNFSFLDYSNNDLKENTIINNNESEGSILVLNSNIKECNCNNIKNVNQRRISNINKSKLFDKLEREFNFIERKNNGIFPITVFEDMLKYIYIIPSLVEIIGNYLRLKSQKTFFSFELLKELLEIISLPIQNDNIKFDDISKSLFDLLSYPKNYILTKSFSLFLKSTNPKLSSKQINSIYKEQDIQDKITKNTFPELLKLVINDIEKSFINMNYIQYIFFKGKCPDKQKEKECILLLLNGLSLDDYIKEKTKTEDSFYIINYDFWENWNEYINSPLNLKSKNLKIFNNQISNKNGKLNDDLIYGKDYIVVTKKIFDLFSYWYGPIVGNDLKRDKIYLDNEKNYKPPKNLPSIFIGEETISKRKYEIELFPIFFLFYNFEQMQKNDTLEKLKENLREIENNPSGKGMYYPFSRISKFFDLLKPLEISINSPLDINKTRLWLYYKGRFGIVDFDKKLEDENINGSGIILLEINNGNWPSEKIIKDNNNNKNNNIFVGLNNIGNTCYLNSILQTFLNNIELRDILLRKNSESEFLQFLINKKTKGKLIKEFINLLKLKWKDGIKNITPNKFKQICGEYNENFQNFEQQDAYDFYTFLLESLHEDTNIKSNKIKLKNPENYNSTEEELGNEYWANNIRNNASYFYSLYLGQLKSTLRCTICNKSKISFEHFSSLSLPIPEGNKIILDIDLFRLPFTFKPYYNINNNNFNNVSLRKSLQKIKINSIGIYADESELSTDSMLDNNKNNDNYEKEQFNTIYFEKTIKKNKNLNKKEDMFSNALNINIPIKIRIEVDRKEKCNKIIEILKSMNELELEKDSNYTYHIIIFNGNYINDSLQIDECFISYQTIAVYELLNFNGIQKVFNYNDLNNIQIKDLEKEKIPLMLNSNENNNENELDNSIEINKSNKLNNNINKTISSENETIIDFEEENNEIILPILHRYRKSKNTHDNLIENPSFEIIITYQDFILVTTKNSIKSYDLYEFIWEKFEYFLDSPAKYKNNLWWKGNLKISKINSTRNYNKIKPCSPFVLKVLKKKTKSCSFCPWFKFCTGCILDPNNMNYLNFNIDDIIIVEWCREVVNNEIQDKNKYLILNHHSINDYFDNNNDNDIKIPLIECLKLFTKEEELKDIQCENCKKKTIFKKSYQIERLPQYLVLVLKRFKYTKMYTKKIESLITFPIQELDLKDFYCKTKNFPLYDLYSVVNHTGTLSGGHYTCLVNFENNWIKYDDAFINENETNIETNSAYILFYKMRPFNKGNLHFNFVGLMDTAFKIYMKQNKFSNIFNYLLNENNEVIKEYNQDCEYYFGEPVKINNQRGYLTNIFLKGNDYICKVRFEHGYFEFNLKDDIKETIKGYNYGGDENNNLDNKKKIHKCASCYIF